MFKYLFKRDTILATVMVFIVMGLLALIPVNVHVLDPVKMALQDFDYNDMAYSQFNKNSQTSIDTGIVILNIGNAGRSEIAAMIKKSAAEKPLAVGVDVLFNAAKNTGADDSLQQLFSGSNKIVLAYKLEKNESVAEPQGFLFTKSRQKGFANFVGEEGGCIRFFAPQIKNKNETFTSFASMVMQVAYPEKYKILQERDNKTAQINYSRTAEKFIVINGKDYLQDSVMTVSLKDKIVLLGFVSPDENNVEDKHFTPLNKKPSGKTLPDMQGIFIHANIISMIKEGAYISTSPVWINWLIASLLCWLSMGLYIRYFIDRHIWFHLVAKLAQLLSAILFVYIGLLFYYKWDFKMNLTPTLVAIILAVDVLYFYEAITAWMHRHFGYHSLFINAHPH